MRHALVLFAFFLGAVTVAGGADYPGTDGLPLMGVDGLLMAASAITLYRLEGGIQ